MTTHRRADIGLPLTGELVLYDTEFTAWKGSQERLWSAEWEHRELVEIGAVRVSAEDFEVRDTFHRLTRPCINPNLSDYFSKLTGISQQSVDRDGVPLAQLFVDFHKFGDGAAGFVANGDDEAVLTISAGLQGMSIPISPDRFINIRHALARLFGKPPTDLTTGMLPHWLGLPPHGTLHSAVDDAIALARALAELRRIGRI